MVSYSCPLEPRLPSWLSSPLCIARTVTASLPRRAHPARPIAGLGGSRTQQTKDVTPGLPPALRRVVADGALGIGATAVMTLPMALRWRAQPALPPGPVVITERVERLLGAAPEGH